MKKNIKSLLHILVFVLLLGVVILKVTDIMEAKGSRDIYITFFEEAEKYDVIFAGSSHVVYSIYPMELYKNYGIASYNVATLSSRLPTTYYTLMNILQYTSPQLVVIDLNFIYSSEKIASSDTIHTTFDAFPLSYSKFETVNDLFDDDNNDKKLEMLFTLAKYHTRWSMLKEYDFISQTNYNKGAYTDARVATDIEKPQNINKDILPSDDTVGMEYLKKAIELCQSKGIEVLLVGIPYSISEEEYTYFNYGYVLAEEYKIDYLDLFQVENLINYKVDLFDYAHLNSSGAHKLTSYVGEYIIKEYSIEDRRDDSAYNLWSNDYETWVERNIEKLNVQNGINEYLLFLSDTEFECSISLSDKITEDEYPIIYQLIDNIDGIYECGEEKDLRYSKRYSNIKDKSKSIFSNTEVSDIYIAVYRKGTETVISQASFDVSDNIVLVKK